MLSYHHMDTLLQGEIFFKMHHKFPKLDNLSFLDKKKMLLPPFTLEKQKEKMQSTPRAFKLSELIQFHVCRSRRVTN